MIDEITKAIHNYRRDNFDNPTVYITPETARQTAEEYPYGTVDDYFGPITTIVDDQLGTDYVIAAEKLMDLYPHQLFMEHPPSQLLEQLASPELHGDQYVFKVGFELLKDEIELDWELIDRQNLNINVTDKEASYEPAEEIDIVTFSTNGQIPLVADVIRQHIGHTEKMPVFGYKLINYDEDRLLQDILNEDDAEQMADRGFTTVGDVRDASDPVDPRIERQLEHYKERTRCGIRTKQYGRVFMRNISSFDNTWKEYNRSELR